MVEHAKFLTIALQEAEKAFQAGHFPVGALFVDAQGCIVNRTQNTGGEYGGYIFHAELNLLLANQQYLLKHQWKTTLYTTLEPCVMCLGAALISRVGCIVWAADDFWAGSTQFYDFRSNFMSTRPCQLIPHPYLSLQKQSVNLLRSYLEQQQSPHLHPILGTQFL